MSKIEKMSHFGQVKLLADQGDVASQFRLGELYYNGVGVVQHNGEALRWFTKAAEQGASGAQYNLGVMHRYGKATEEDHDASLRWFTKGAEQCHAASICALKHLTEAMKLELDRKSAEGTLKWKMYP